MECERATVWERALPNEVRKIDLYLYLYLVVTLPLR